MISFKYEDNYLELVSHKVSFSFNLKIIFEKNGNEVNYDKMVLYGGNEIKLICKKVNFKLILQNDCILPNSLFVEVVYRFMLWWKLFIFRNFQQPISIRH